MNKYTDAYNKERRRIQRQIRSMEKRGYFFEKPVLPDRPKKITAGSVRRLDKITGKSLYEKAKYKTKTGEIVTGRQGRGIERQAAAAKGAATRKYGAEGAEDLTIGEMVWDKLQNMIEENRLQGRVASADYMQRLLDEQVATYGKDKTLRAIGYAESTGVTIDGRTLMEHVDMGLHYRPGSQRFVAHVTAITMIITGTIPSAEEMKEIERVTEADTGADSFEEAGESPFD